MWRACAVRFTFFTTRARICGPGGNRRLCEHWISIVLLFYSYGNIWVWMLHGEVDSTDLLQCCHPLLMVIQELSQCLVRHGTMKACGVSHQPHIQDTLCSTRKSPLPEAFALLGCYAGYIGGWLLMFWNSQIGPIFKGQFFLDILILEVGPIGCPKTTITKYQPTLFNIPEEWRPELHRGRNVKPPPYLLYMWLGSPLSWSRHFGGEKLLSLMAIVPNSLVIQPKATYYATYKNTNFMFSSIIQGASVNRWF
jgi:hypothetical protein